MLDEIYLLSWLNYMMSVLLYHTYYNDYKKQKFSHFFKFLSKDSLNMCEDTNHIGNLWTFICKHLKLLEN